MSQTYDFYNTRAKEAAKEAKGAELDNVRDRALRSEKVWRGLAEQARQVDLGRARDERLRAKRREADAASAGEE